MILASDDTAVCQKSRVFCWFDVVLPLFCLFFFLYIFRLIFTFWFFPFPYDNNSINPKPHPQQPHDYLTIVLSLSYKSLWVNAWSNNWMMLYETLSGFTASLSVVGPLFCHFPTWKMSWRRCTTKHNWKLHNRDRKISDAWRMFMLLAAALFISLSLTLDFIFLCLFVALHLMINASFFYVFPSRQENFILFFYIITIFVIFTALHILFIEIVN